MRLRILPFKPGHADFMTLSSVFQGEEKGLEQLLEVRSRAKNCRACTVVAGNTPIAILGLTEIHPGCAECWALIGEEVKSHSIAFVRLAMRLRDVHERILKLHRLQIMIREGFPHLIRWAVVMGFQKEGLLRKCGPQGDNYFIYARVR